MRRLIATLSVLLVFSTPVGAQDFCLDLCVDGCMITATDALAALNAAVGLNPEMCMPSTTVTVMASTTTSTTSTTEAASTTTSTTTSTTLPSVGEACNVSLCVEDQDLQQDCETWLTACLAAGEEGDEDECILGAGFICQGGACGRELCAEDAGLAQECRDFLTACLAGADKDSDVEACVAVALFKCGEGL